ncbi:MAG: hypothetical protein AB8B64_26225 [Granulosicoccus sp.]
MYSLHPDNVERFGHRLSVIASVSGWKLLAIAAGFDWSGFVRSGLGFGGAALTLPLLLLVHNDVLLNLLAAAFLLAANYRHAAR